MEDVSDPEFKNKKIEGNSDASISNPTTKNATTFGSSAANAADSDAAAAAASTLTTN